MSHVGPVALNEICRVHTRKNVDPTLMAGAARGSRSAHSELSLKASSDIRVEMNRRPCPRSVEVADRLTPSLAVSSTEAADVGRMESDA